MWPTVDFIEVFYSLLYCSSSVFFFRFYSFDKKLVIAYIIVLLCAALWKLYVKSTL